MSKNGNDKFHDGDDIFDLYNACNGEIDIQKIDQLSDEERELFDVDRLKEVAAHVAGCDRCKSIIKLLNWARGELREGPFKEIRDDERDIENTKLDE